MTHNFAAAARLCVRPDGGRPPPQGRSFDGVQQPECRISPACALTHLRERIRLPWMRASGSPEGVSSLANDAAASPGAASLAITRGKLVLPITTRGKLMVPLAAGTAFKSRRAGSVGGPGRQSYGSDAAKVCVTSQWRPVPRHDQPRRCPLNGHGEAVLVVPTSASATRWGPRGTR